MEKKKKVYLTTPAYYPSANPHIGNAYCTVLVDILSRYFRLAGYDTYFVTGTDEHGSKIAKNAKNNNMSPIEFVDGIVKKFENLWNILDIKYDQFIRTSMPKHIELVQKVFSSFIKNNDVFLNSYEGWYCVSCESFWSDSQVGKEHLCPDCGRPVNKEKEEVYFFNTQKYLPSLLKYYESNPKFIMPIIRKNEMLNSFIKPGLENLSVTRTTLDWGVHVLENPKHVVYVWLDALLNYLSALNYLTTDDSLYKRYWESDDSRIIHVVGADINRFHTIYWPMFLEAINVRKPDEVFVHGLMMMLNEKMSKSKGNVIDPIPLCELYSSDALRFYLVREMHFGDNGQFSPEQFCESVNRDLVNNYGNLLNRSLTMINKYCEGHIPTIEVDDDEVNMTLRRDIEEYISKYHELFDSLKPTEAITLVFELVDKGNKYIEVKQPWNLLKEGNNDMVQKTMAHLAFLIYVCTNLLAPVLSRKTKEVLSQLGLRDDTPTFDYLHNYKVLEGAIINKKEVLFPRLDIEKESDAIRDLMKGK